MERVPRSLGATPWLAATVALLLPALAWLQYDWVNQLATADRERRERTLRAAGAQFTSALDADVSRLAGSLQIDGAMAERRDWDAYALRYDTAVDNGAAAVVSGVWFAELDDAAGAAPAIRLQQWSPDRRTFLPVDWPPALDTVRAELSALPPTAVSGPAPRSPRDFFAYVAGVGDERTLVLPIVRVQAPREPGVSPDRILSDVRMRGFTIVRLDADALARDRLPALAAEHFPADAGYRVAVVANADGRVLFESSPGAAVQTAASPDLATTFMAGRVGPMMIFARVSSTGATVEGRVDRLPPPPPPALGDPAADRRVVSMFEVRERDGDRGGRDGRGRGGPHAHGHWTLRVQHAAGSLEAAVAASRRRNLLLSGGTLALLGVVVALIAVSARRAQALARQHMEFVAAVSHELRTPVAVINSAAGNLADGVVSDASRVKRYGATIQGEARRLGETVERVLQLAGLSSGRTLPMAPVSAAAIVREALEQLAPDAARAGVDVQVHVAPDLPPVLGDAGTLRSAVGNLVGNAIKYAGDDRWVRVTASAATSPWPEVRIAVEDHGAGLEADEHRRVFEPFYRGRHAVTQQVQGSGLGLSLVRRIADAHGGRVELQSETGRGSTFTICLPAAPGASGAADAAPAGDAAASPVGDATASPAS
jgi:signal transduction histidine kinase